MLAVNKSTRTTSAPANAIMPQRPVRSRLRAPAGGATGMARAAVGPVAARAIGLSGLRGAATGAAGTNTREVAMAGDCATGNEAIVIVGSVASVGVSTAGVTGSSATASNSWAINSTLA